MAVTKPDVRTSIYDLYDISFGRIIDWCHHRRPTFDDVINSSTETAMVEDSEAPRERIGEEEKEEEPNDPLKEEPIDRRTATQAGSRIVTRNEEPTGSLIVASASMPRFLSSNKKMRRRKSQD